jgi:hypothetical protein
MCPEKKRNQLEKGSVTKACCNHLGFPAGCFGIHASQDRQDTEKIDQAISGETEV